MQKKNFWLVALASALTIAFVGGCPSDNDTNNPSNNPSNAPGMEDFYEWHAMDMTKTGDVKKDNIINMVHAGKMYIGTKTGLVVWDITDETKNFTTVDLKVGFKPSTPATKNLDLSGAEINNLTVLADKHVAFISKGKGIGTVKDTTADAFVMTTDAEVLALIPKDAGKFLYASIAKTVGFQDATKPLGDAFDVTLKAKNNKAFSEAITAYALNKNGDLLLAQENGFLTLPKADIGVSNRPTTEDDKAPSIKSDNAKWKDTDNEITAALTFGDVVVVGTSAKLYSVDKAGKAEELADGSVYGLKADGNVGAWALVKGKGVVYVKADGTVDADKAINKTKITGTNKNVQTDNTKNYTLASDNIIGAVVVGKKTYFATEDEGILVRETKQRKKTTP